jgi:hypothetical protein
MTQRDDSFFLSLSLAGPPGAQCSSLQAVAAAAAAGGRLSDSTVSGADWLPTART